ncbi:MAG: glycosyl transferase [Gammaproteobacteria bacterium]|nr:glycosyl transferase [Gammaproteobacteria bacterium]|tara:strand:+ start:5856 stop:6554 length:699 start_codon:yes stop_codon:yes gene_type:complete
MLLSIIIPCFNESNTIKKVIDKINNQKYIKKQIILVDDNSTDGTKDIIKNNLENIIDKVIYQRVNKGKGAAIRAALPYVKGDVVIIQDADLEYNPSDYKILLEAMTKMGKKVVYGSRVLGKPRYKNKNFTSLYRIFFNHALTILTNILYRQKLTDAHTCYKVFDASLISKIKLIEDDFTFCPEFTAKVSKLGIKIHEVPISYNGRSYQEGKKIKMSDGIRAVYVLFKNYIFN